MKTMRRKMMAAILTICGTMTLSLTSCSEKIDNPVLPVNPTEEVVSPELKQALLGLHLDPSGYVVGEEAFRVWDLHEDNTFTSYDLYYDDDLEFVVDTLTGTWKPFADQEIWWDETSTEKLCGFSVIYDRESDYYVADEPDEYYYVFADIDDEEDDSADDDDDDEWFYLSGDAVNMLAMLDEDADDENAQARTRAAAFGQTSEEAIKTVADGLVSGVTRQDISDKNAAKEFFDAAYGKMNTAGAKKFYNPNEAKGLFTRDNWRDQDIILLYVDKNTGTQTETVGPNTYYFLEAALPWSKSTKNSNLPLDFCDDLYPENGWELAMNSCGSTAAQNLNYFALYNKYTGILRIFTYVPSTFNVSTANDHAWEVTLSEDLAQHMGLKFGLPMTDKIVDKAQLGMDRGRDYSMYITPYVSSTSSDQKITPNPGWWAFDIDLSLYREGFSTVGQEMRLQMRAWNEDNITLNSKINAQIKEKAIPQTFGLSSVTGIVGQVKTGYSTIVDIVNTIGSITTGNVGESLKSLVNLAKTGYGVYKGIKGEVSKIGVSAEPYYITKQYIDGTISTDGLNKGSRAVSGVYSPTFSLSEFYIDNSTLGQGVWNLRHAPVVYEFDEAYYNWGVLYRPDPEKACVCCVFDPSSVDVVLNPRLFNTNNVEYVEVYSVCGVNTATKHDANDNYRKAYGMNGNHSVYYNHFLRYSGDSKDNLVNVKYDSQADYPAEYQTGKFPVTIQDQEKVHKWSFDLYGRGDEKYLIEPKYIRRCKESEINGETLPVGGTLLPCYEVTVTVAIKMKDFDEPLYYTRRYLPEIKQFKVGDTKINYSRSLEQYEKIKNDPLRKGHTALLDIQMQHYKNVLLFFRPQFEQQEAYSLKPLYFDKSKYTKPNNLFDGNPSTNCYTDYSNKHRGVWTWEFQSSRAITPKYYAMTTSSRASQFNYTQNPKIWELYARNAKGEWVRLDARDSEHVYEDKLPQANSERKVYECRYNPGTYNRFKLVVSKAWTSESVWVCLFSKDSGCLELAELEVLENYDEKK